MGQQGWEGKWSMNSIMVCKGIRFPACQHPSLQKLEAANKPQIHISASEIYLTRVASGRRQIKVLWKGG